MDNGSDEDQQIYEELDQPLVVGETWYLLDSKWLKSWKNYTGVGQVSKSSDEAPGPVDNSGLLEGDILKKHLIEEQDYELIPEESWNRLRARYGVLDGQKPIARKTIETGTYSKQTTVEVYPPEISMKQHGGDTVIKETFSRCVTIGEVHKWMKKHFEMPDNRKTRVYIQDCTDDLKEGETLNDSGVGPTQILVLEQQNDDETWPRTSPPSYNEAVMEPSTSTTKKYALSSSNFTNGASYSTRSSGNSFYGSRSEQPGLCGLSNLGNTCFMNSAIQCLSNVPSLTMYFQNKKYKQELNYDNPLGMHGKLAKAYASLMHDIWSGHHSSVSPREFKYNVASFAPQFSGYQQHDSQELLAFLIDGLHEDLNRIAKKPYIELKDSDGRPDAVVAQEAWNNHLQRNDSVIVDTFHGLFKSTLVCPTCDRVSITFDPFGFLSLPLPGVGETVVTCHFVSRKRDQPVVKHCVSISKKGCMNDLCIALAKRTGCQSSDLIIADVYNFRFYKVYTGSEKVSQYSERDNLFVFELGFDDGDQDDENDTEYARVFMRHSGPIGMKLFGHPFLIPVKSGVTTYRKFYNSVLSAVWRYIKKECLDDVKMLTELEKCGINESLNGSTEEDFVGDAEKEEQLEKKEEVRLFKLVCINSFGTTIMKELSDDDKPIKFSSDIYFSAEWDQEVSDEYVVENWPASFENDPSVSVNPRKEKSITLQECMKLFTTKEKLGQHDLWYCPKCKEHKQATKKFDLWALPPVLIIHLKRFHYSRWSRDKISRFVDFPTHDLDLSEFVINPEKKHWQKKRKMYNLIGVSNHYGGMGGGHYTAYARNYLNNKWYYFDDSSVTSSSEDKVQTKAAYMLMYQRQDLEEWVHSDAEHEFPFLDSMVSPRSFSQVQGFTYESGSNGNLQQKTCHNGNESLSDDDINDCATTYMDTS